MCYAIDTTPKIGPTQANGKQMISLYDYKTATRRTFVADKAMVDAYQDGMVEKNKNAAKTSFSAIAALVSAFGFASGNKTLKMIGAIASGLFGLMTIIFGAKTVKNSKQLQTVVDDMKAQENK